MLVINPTKHLQETQGISYERILSMVHQLILFYKIVAQQIYTTNKFSGTFTRNPVIRNEGILNMLHQLLLLHIMLVQHINSPEYLQEIQGIRCEKIISMIHELLPLHNILLIYSYMFNI